MSIYGPFFRACRAVLRAVRPRYTAKCEEKAPSPAVFVVHHQNLKGPMNVLMWYPRETRLWSLDCFFTFRGAYRQYMDFTFTKRYGMPRWLAAVPAAVAAAVVSRIYRSGGFIPVYRGSKRIIETFRESGEALARGESLLICPDVAYSSEQDGIGEIYEGFVSVERYAMRACGRHAAFVPLKLDHEKQTITALPAVFFGDGDYREEKKRVAAELQKALS